MTRIHAVYTTLVLGLFSTASVAEVTMTISCLPPIEVGFFNGVWNTVDATRSSARHLGTLFGYDWRGHAVGYLPYTNHTGSEADATGLQDLAEVFIQRADEIDSTGELSHRWEAFWEAQNGDGPILAYIRSLFTNAAGILDAMFQEIIGRVAGWTAKILSSPPTGADYAEQRTRLDEALDDGRMILMLAHSQGNLFVNKAYEYLASIGRASDTTVVHLAPASTYLSPDSDYTLASIDLVINALRLSGFNSVPAINLWATPSVRDPSGHKLIETYLDSNRELYPQVRAQIFRGLEKLASKPQGLEVDVGELHGLFAANFAADANSENADAGWVNEPGLGYSPDTGTFSLNCRNGTLPTGVISGSFTNASLSDSYNAEVRVRKDAGTIFQKSVFIPTWKGQSVPAVEITISKIGNGSYRVVLQ